MDGRYRVATAANFEFLASRWLLDLRLDFHFDMLTRDVPPEDVTLLLYNAVSAFLVDHRVTTLVEETGNDKVTGFAVINSAASQKEVHLAHFWLSEGRLEAPGLMKMACLDRKELVAYDEKTYMQLPLESNGQINYLPLLARTGAGMSPLAKTMRPRVLQHVTIALETKHDD